VAVAVLAALAPGVSAEEANTDCGDRVSGCVERQETFVLIPGSGNIMAAPIPIKPGKKPLEAYAEMLPDGFDLPAQPRFLVHAAEYFGGTEAPVVQDVPGIVEGNGGQGYGTHWMEMSLYMRVARTLSDGSVDEGWYFVAIGTDGNIAYGGIDTGYPKYRAHTFFDRNDGANVPSYWKAVATVVGREGTAHANPGTRTTSLAVDWRESGPAQLPADAAPTSVGYYMNPVHAGPQTQRTVGRFMAPAELSWLTGGGTPDLANVPPATALDVRPGSVTYSIEDDLTLYDDQSEKPLPSMLAGTKLRLSDIIETSGTQPGWAFEVKQGFLFSQNETIQNADGTTP
jgi:hypothetical protein